MVWLNGLIIMVYIIGYYYLLFVYIIEYHSYYVCKVLAVDPKGCWRAVFDHV